MKTFIIKLILFLIPLGSIIYCADKILSNKLKKSNSYADGEYSIWNDLYEGKINSEIVIYGSSRAMVQINPILIEDSMKTSVYNLGINGHPFHLQYLRHLLLLKYNSKPKIIIHSLDVFTLTKGKDLYNPDQFLPYMLFNNEMLDATIVFNGYKWIDFKIPLIRYYGKKEAILHTIFLNLNPQKNKAYRVKGYQGMDLSWNDDLKNAQKELQSINVELDSATISLFEKYLNDCRQSCIKVVFVYTPEFIGGQRFVNNRTEIIDLYKNLSKKYNILFYDYSADSISYNREYFYNSGHLNKKGAELFTNKFIMDIKENIK